MYIYILIPSKGISHHIQDDRSGTVCPDIDFSLIQILSNKKERPHMPFQKGYIVPLYI